jgi:tyrosyl-tRNA synthetase
MSKSLGNAIGINEPASEMYGKLMSVSDELMWKYWVFLTDLRGSEIDAMKAEVASGALHPMVAKKELARVVTAGFHGEGEAEVAAENWAKQFQQRGVSDDAPVVQVSRTAEGLLHPTNGIQVAKLLQLAGLAASSAEARRKLAENAVSMNGDKYSGTMIEPSLLGETPVVRLGKRSVRVEWVD